MFLIMENISEILLLSTMSLKEFICVQLKDFQIKKKIISKYLILLPGRPIKTYKIYQK